MKKKFQYARWLKVTNRILFFLVIILLILVSYNELVNIKNYKAKIFHKVYFALFDGHTYKPGDTVKIQKFSSGPFRFNVKEILRDSVVSMNFISPKVVDLRGRKFFNLNPNVVTDYFIPLTPGIYLISLETESEAFYDMVFVNDTTHSQNRRIKVVLSEYTWIAYNKFGGRSNYFDVVTPKIVKFFKKFHMSRNHLYPHNMYRPFISNSEEIKQWQADGFILRPEHRYHCVMAELPLISYLWKNYPDELDILECREFESYSGPRKNTLFIFNGHSEYWSDRMMGLLKELIPENNILFFSGNNIYRKVKPNGRNFYVTEYLIKPEFSVPLTGLFSTPDGMDKNSSYLIVRKDHFLFQGIDAHEMGGDYAVGIETDKIHSLTPDNVEVLAVGKKCPADLVIMENGNGYFLLNMGSIGVYNGLSDANFTRFVDNFIRFSLRKKPIRCT